MRTDERETTRIVRAWLEEGVTVLPDRVLDRVLDEVPATRQHGAWPAPSGLSPALGAAAALVVALVLGVATFGERIGDAIRNPADPEPAPLVRSLESASTGPLEPGAYEIRGDFPVRLLLELPEGWSKSDFGADHVLLASDPAGAPELPPSGIRLGFFTVGNLFADPCEPQGRMVEPPVGPSVEDLVAGFRDLPGYRAPVAQPTTIDGYLGSRIEPELELFMCSAGQAQLWQTPTGWVRTPLWTEETTTLWILDIDGVRLVIDATTYPATAEEDRTEVMAIIDSLRIGPADDAR